MGELRWILIVCGAVLLVAIYLWGRRSGKQTAEGDLALERGRAKQFSPREQPALSVEPGEDSDQLGDPAYDESVQLREPQARPTGWDDFHDETATAATHAHSADSPSEDFVRDPRARDIRRTRVEPTFSEPPVFNDPPDFEEPLIADDAFETSDEGPIIDEPVGHRPDESRLEIRAEVRTETRSEHAEVSQEKQVESEREPAAPTLSMSDTPPAPRRIERRKIIALRLAAGSERFAGRMLRQALESEHLQHGKYQVFHRLHTDGVSVFSIASMVEPGTFDLEKMPGSSYPGVTLFAQLPGPVPGVQVLHDLVNCGKRLQESLGGILQDDRGVPLTVHRIDRVRQEIVEFERAPARETHRHSAS